MKGNVIPNRSFQTSIASSTKQNNINISTLHIKINKATHIHHQTSYPCVFGVQPWLILTEALTDLCDLPCDKGRTQFLAPLPRTSRGAPKLFTSFLTLFLARPDKHADFSRKRPRRVLSGKALSLKTVFQHCFKDRHQRLPKVLLK